MCLFVNFDGFWGELSVSSLRTAILITPILRLGTPSPTTLLLRPLYYDPPLLRPPRHYDHPVITTTMLFYPPPPTPSIITSPILSPPPTLWPPRLYLFFSSKQKYINFSYSTTIPYSYTLPSLPLYYHSPFGVPSSFPSRSYLTSITVISVPA